MSQFTNLEEKLDKMKKTTLLLQVRLFFGYYSSSSLMFFCGAKVEIACL